MYHYYSGNTFFIDTKVTLNAINKATDENPNDQTQQLQLISVFSALNFFCYKEKEKY